MKMGAGNIDSLMNFVNQISLKTQLITDKAVYLLDYIVNRLGQNGYLFIGFLANTLMFISTTSLKYYPKVDWSICLIARGVSTYMFSALSSAIFNKDTNYSGNSLKYVNIRNILLGIHQVFFQYGLIVLPISVVWVIINSSPLFVFVINYFMFSSPLSAKQVFFLVISLCGVCLITNPEIYSIIINIFFGSSQKELTNKENQPESDSKIQPVNIVAILFIFAQMLWSYGVSVIKKATQVSSLAINLHFGLILIIFGSISLFHNIQEKEMAPIYDYICVFIFYGIGSFLPSLLFIQGTIVAKCQGKYSLTNYVTVFYSYLFQIYHEHKNPSIIEFIGLFFAFFGLYKVLVK